MNEGDTVWLIPYEEVSGSGLDLDWSTYEGEGRLWQVIGEYALVYVRDKLEQGKNPLSKVPVEQLVIDGDVTAIREEMG